MKQRKPTPEQLADALIERFGYAIVPHLYGWEPQANSAVTEICGGAVPTTKYRWNGKSTRAMWERQFQFIRETWPDWDLSNVPPATEYKYFAKAVRAQK